MHRKRPKRSRGKETGIDHFVERQDWVHQSGHVMPPSRLCPWCFRTGRIGETCPNCGGETVFLGRRFRVPRRTDSKRKWMHWINRFVHPHWHQHICPVDEWGSRFAQR